MIVVPLQGKASRRFFGQKSLAKPNINVPCPSPIGRICPMGLICPSPKTSNAEPGRHVTCTLSTKLRKISFVFGVVFGD
jgi:hypothetical protein